MNFLEYALWFQDKYSADKTDSKFVWQDREGFIYKAEYKPPVRIDTLFLLYVLSKSQRDDWKGTVETSRFDVIKGCGIAANKYWYKRLEESLQRWMSVKVEFQGTFYDGKKYQTMHFGIIDSWSIHADSKLLTIRFSPEWLTRIQHSNYFKLLDFEQIKQLRSPLATRLYEILVKTFQNRTVWQIGALKLATKIPMNEQYPAHIVPKIQTAIRRINEKTELQLRLEVKRPERGKALLIFHKVQNAEAIEPTKIQDVSQKESGALEELLLLLPKKERSKKTIIKGIEASLARKGKDYVEYNILYANTHAKKNYRVYLLDALKKDWGAEWWEDEQEKEKQRKRELENEAVRKVEEEEAIKSQRAHMKELAEKELEKAKKTYLLDHSEDAFLLWESHAHEQIEAEMPNAPDSEKENAFNWRLIGYLQSGR